MATNMRRVNFHLKDDLFNRLNALCSRYGASKSEIIRRALEQYLQMHIEKP